MKDAKGHGSNGRGGGGMPIPGHAYHSLPTSTLQYIAKDAGAAAVATRGMSMYNPNSGQREDTEGKYLDQVNNAASVMGYRARGGTDFSRTGAEHVHAIAAAHGISTDHLRPLASDPVHEKSPIDGQYFKRG